MTATGKVCAQDDLAGAILSAISRRVGGSKFQAWFRRGTTLSVDDGRVKIGAANPFIAGWIERHFADDVVAAAEEVTGRRLELTIGIDPVLGRQLRKQQLDAQARLVRQAAVAGGARRVLPRKPLRHRLSEFVVGASNQLAYSAALAVASEGKAPFNPLFIHGACGVGKTHLLQGICNALGDLPDPPAWKYLTAEEFTNDFVRAIRRKDLSSFRETYRGLDVLVIDDVHFLVAKKATQEEFLHTFNTIESAGKQVVMASDAHPRLLGQLTEQLVSRFLSGMVVRIESPDRALRVNILERFAQRMRLAVPGEVLEYIAANVSGSVRELEGALVKLAALAGLTGKPVTPALAREGLGDHLARTDSAVTVGDIETSVAAFFGITAADLHSSRRTHTVSLARALAMFLARRHTRMSFPEIGRFMGKNHSSVVLAVQRVEGMLQSGARCTWSTPAGPKSMPAKDLLDLLNRQFP